MSIYSSTAAIGPLDVTAAFASTYRYVSPLDFTPSRATHATDAVRADQCHEFWSHTHVAE